MDKKSNLKTYCQCQDFHEIIDQNHCKEIEKCSTRPTFTIKYLFICLSTRSTSLVDNMEKKTVQKNKQLTELYQNKIFSSKFLKVSRMTPLTTKHVIIFFIFRINNLFQKVAPSSIPPIAISNAIYRIDTRLSRIFSVSARARA